MHARNFICAFQFAGWSRVGSIKWLIACESFGLKLGQTTFIIAAAAFYCCLQKCSFDIRSAKPSTAHDCVLNWLLSLAPGALVACKQTLARLHTIVGSVNQMLHRLQNLSKSFDRLELQTMPRPNKFKLQNTNHTDSIQHILLIHLINQKYCVNSDICVILAIIWIFCIIQHETSASARAPPICRK